MAGVQALARFVERFAPDEAQREHAAAVSSSGTLGLASTFPDSAARRVADDVVARCYRELGDGPDPFAARDPRVLRIAGEAVGGLALDAAHDAAPAPDRERAWLVVQLVAVLSQMSARLPATRRRDIDEAVGRALLGPDPVPRKRTSMDALLHHARRC